MAGKALQPRKGISNMGNDKEDLTVETGDAAALRKEDGKCFEIAEGGWAFKAFMAKARALSRRNAFSQDEEADMVAKAMISILGAKNRYDASSGNMWESYMRTVMFNALSKAAADVADDRRLWRESRVSLDADVGEGDGAMALVDMVHSGAGLAANEKFWDVPRSVRMRRLRRERKANSSAVRKLLERMEDGFADRWANPDEPEIDAAACESSMRALGEDHLRAVEEMGLADCSDEVSQKPDQPPCAPGFGDTAAAVFREVLRLDVLLVVNRLEPRLRRWCELVLEGYNPVAAYKAARMSRSNYYAYALPKLRKAFAGLAYAL